MPILMKTWVKIIKSYKQTTAKVGKSFFFDGLVEWKICNEKTHWHWIEWTRVYTLYMYDAYFGFCVLRLEYTERNVSCEMSWEIFRYFVKWLNVLSVKWLLLKRFSLINLRYWDFFRCFSQKKLYFVHLIDEFNAN